MSTELPDPIPTAPPASPTPAQPGLFARPAERITILVLGGLLAIGAGAGITYAIMNGNNSAATQPAEVAAPVAHEAPAAADPAPVAQEAPATPQAPAPKPTTAAPRPTTQAPVVAPEVNGLCPSPASEVFYGTTKEFVVRICAQAGGYFYLGGNDALGYMLLPAERRSGSDGSYAIAANGDTVYNVTPSGLVVTPGNGESWTQEWHSGNMSGLRGW